MAIAAPAIAALGMGAAGLSSYLGQSSTNKTNIRLSQENRDFQERMSNTSYQRAIKDLEAAGLNPLLAVGAQASTPGGSVAQVDNAAGKGASSALEAMRISRENATSGAQIKSLDAQAMETKARTAINIGNNASAYAIGEPYVQNKAAIDKAISDAAGGTASAIKNEYNNYLRHIGKNYSVKDYFIEKQFERKNR